MKMLQHLTEDHCRFNEAHRRYCAEHGIDPEECEIDCYGLMPTEEEGK